MEKDDEIRAMKALVCKLEDDLKACKKHADNLQDQLDKVKSEYHAFFRKINNIDEKGNTNMLS